MVACGGKWSSFTFELGASCLIIQISFPHLSFVLQKSAPKKKKAAPKKKTATKKVRWRYEYIRKRRLHPCWPYYLFSFHPHALPFAFDNCFITNRRPPPRRRRPPPRRNKHGIHLNANVGYRSGERGVGYGVHPWTS